MSTVSSAPGDEKLGAFVASMEASSPENAADALQVMLNRAATGGYGKGLSGVISGREQFSPISAAIYGTSADPGAQAKYGPIAAKLPGNTPQEKFIYLQKVAAEPDGLNKLQQIFGGGDAGVAATILNDPKYLEESRKNIKGALSFRGYNTSGSVKVRSGGNYFFDFSGKVGSMSEKSQDNSITQQPQETLIRPTTPAQPQVSTTTPTTPKVEPAPSIKPPAVAQAISQPVQKMPELIQLPPTVIDASVPQPQQDSGGNIITPSSQGGGGPDVPFLPTGNPDNFFTMYSKIVYNIVDG